MPPTMYKMMSPGRMNSDAIENPSARTFGGIVSDSVAKMPGTRSADTPVITTCISDREPQRGREREPDPRAGDDDAEEREHAQADAGVAAHQPRRERDAERDADELRGFGQRGDETAGRLVEMEHLLVVERREREQADDRRGEERQRVPDAAQGLRPARGCGPTPRTTVGSRRCRRRRSPAPAAARSKWPRPGSVTRRPRYANTSVGGTKTKNGTRQPQICAISPPSSGPTIAPSAMPMRWKPNTSARTSGGYMSGMSELWVGVTTARPMPEPERAMHEHPHA